MVQTMKNSNPMIFNWAVYNTYIMLILDYVWVWVIREQYLTVHVSIINDNNNKWTTSYHSLVKFFHIFQDDRSVSDVGNVADPIFITQENNNARGWLSKMLSFQIRNPSLTFCVKFFVHMFFIGHFNFQEDQEQFSVC